MNRTSPPSSQDLRVEYRPQATGDPTLAPQSLGLHVEYRPDLHTSALIAEIRGLLERQRIIERLMCRYLADLADRIAESRPVDPFGGDLDVYEVAEHLLGLDVRRTRERVRVGRALRSLPRIEQAFERGEIGYTRVREITRVARPESEDLWLDLGKALPTRQLERRVIAAGAHARDTQNSQATTPGPHDHDRPATPGLGPPEKVRLVFDVPVDGWLVVQRALQAVRARAEHTLTDAEALIALAREITLPRSEGNGSPAVCNGETPTVCNGETPAVRDSETPAVRDSEMPAASNGGSLAVGSGEMPAVGSGNMHAGLPTLDEGVSASGRGASTPAGSQGLTREGNATPARSQGLTREGNATPADSQGSEPSGATPAGSREGATLAASRGLGPSRATPAGSRESATGGGPRSSPIDAVDDGNDEATRNAAMILRLMASRRRWHAEELYQRTGLSLGLLNAALFKLQLEGVVRRDLAGYHLTYAA